MGIIRFDPGAGHEDSAHPKWWPLYHRMLEAGKKAMVFASTREELLASRREFGEQCKAFYITTWAKTRAEAEHLLRLMDW